jgi:hypothetical protein
MLFAADCAERCLPLYEREHPDDLRVRQAIEARRLYARGTIDKTAWTAIRDSAKASADSAAASAVAWAAASAAARDAARDAARAAAWAAASAAARAATWAAAWDAAWAAERKWQWDRVREYLLPAKTK